MRNEVALATIEWADDEGQTHRLAPGDEVPAGFPSESYAELKKYGSIGSADEYAAAKQAEAEAQAVQGLSAQAEALGYRLVKSSDRGSGSDKKA